MSPECIFGSWKIYCPTITYSCSRKLHRRLSLADREERGARAGSQAA
jgi:hypothetical protein